MFGNNDYKNATVPMDNIPSIDKKASLVLLAIFLIGFFAVYFLPDIDLSGGNWDDEMSIRSDFVLPDSEYMVYDESDFIEMELDYDDVQLAINELYALYGYEFGPSLYEYFSQYDWYDPDTKDPYVVENRFSDMDRETFLNLVEYRKKLK